MITINISKAKDIAHQKRRLARSKELAPYDDIIMKQIPGTNPQQAEAVRQAIRIKHEEMQNKINSANTLAEIKDAVGIALNQE